MTEEKIKKSGYTMARKDSMMKYQKERMVQFNLRFNKEYDADILEKLNSVPNKRQYIIGLIREDIAREREK